MQTAFLIIISLIGTAYAIWTHQGKTSLGLLIMTIAFVLQIPNLAAGFGSQIYLALSLIIFTIGVFVIVWKKKPIEEKNKIEHEENSEK